MAGLVKLDADDVDYYAQPLVGMYVMALLADACAGDSVEKVTDRPETYSFLYSMMVAEAGLSIQKVEPSKAANGELLVPIAVRGISTATIPLRNVLTMRLDEVKSGGHHLRAFRTNYAAALRAHIEQVSKESNSRKHVAELQVEFERGMQQDLAMLKDALKLAKYKFVFSKEMGVMAIAGAGLLADPISSSLVLSSALKTVTWGALISDGLELKKQCLEALGKHSTSWLYLASNRARWPLVV
jgi:hypothetical protein